MHHLDFLEPEPRTALAMLLAMMRWRSARSTKALEWISNPLVNLANMHHLDFLEPEPRTALATGVRLGRL